MEFTIKRNESSIGGHSTKSNDDGDDQHNFDRKTIGYLIKDCL